MPKLTQPQQKFLARVVAGGMTCGQTGSTRGVMHRLDAIGLIANTRGGTRLIVTDEGKAALRAITPRPVFTRCIRCKTPNPKWKSGGYSGCCNADIIRVDERP